MCVCILSKLIQLVVFSVQRQGQRSRMHNFVCGTADWAMCSAQGKRVKLLCPYMVTPSGYVLYASMLCVYMY